MFMVIKQLCGTVFDLMLVSNFNCFNSSLMLNLRFPGKL